MFFNKVSLKMLQMTKIGGGTGLCVISEIQRVAIQRVAQEI